MESLHKKEQIFQRGTDLFYEYGFTGASMRRLAAEVSLEVSSLYSHIRSKDEILLEICRRVGIQLYDVIDKIYGNTQDTKQKIKSLILAHIKICLDNGKAFRVYQREAKHLPDAIRAELLVSQKKYQKRCLNIIKEGIKTKIIKDIPAEVIYSTMLASLTWMDPDKLSQMKKSEIKRLTKQLYRLLVSGIKK